jgi:hypothetical protein
MRNTVNATVVAENAHPVTESSVNPVATTEGAGVAPCGRKAAAKRRSSAGTATAGLPPATRRPRMVGTAAPLEVTEAAEPAEPRDLGGGQDAGSVRERVWAVLQAHPGTTAAELAAAARVGRSTVSKLMATWAGEDSATATAGATGRAARRWTATPNTRPRRRPAR